MTEKFDVVVIGGGPGGYVAAIRCAQLGLSTACIDRTVNTEGKPSLGGTCLNIGCIPSKALLDSSERYEQAMSGLTAHGIDIEGVSLNLTKMQARKEKIVSELTSGVGMLLKANKIKVFHGHGRLHKNRDTSFESVDGSIESISGNHIILATGSTPITLPSLPIDEDVIVDSTGALEFNTVPASLGIIGAGVIGLELGSVWRRLGAKVTILEAAADFLALADKNVRREALKQLKKQGLKIKLGAMVKRADVNDGKCDVEYELNNKVESEEFDKLIVAVGRKPVTDGLFDDDCLIETDSKGFIVVDDHCNTSMAGVYAVGDVVRGPMLAHKASEEGVAVAERISTGHGHVDFNTVPWVIYTHPEIAWVGKTEDECAAANIKTNCGTFAFAATGRAKAMGETAGFVKIIADAKTDLVLGAHIVGPHASELIGELVLAMEYKASAEDLARTIHAHPTLSEAVHESALAVEKRAIHKAN